MLDVITDFWKPVKKTGQEKLNLDRLQIGSQITFGNVPHTFLSGNRFHVVDINTYQFGQEHMTSFVLVREEGQEESQISLIVASADGERYLAISRRVPFAERMRMFDPTELEAVMEQPEVAKLNCHQIEPDWKHWLVPKYKKEISGLRGLISKGDFRKSPLPEPETSQPFDYLLLTSDNNEYALEIERYLDDRFELYATIYRRLSDISALEHPGETLRPATHPVLEIVKPEASPAQDNIPVSEPIKPVEDMLSSSLPANTANDPFVSPQPLTENPMLQSPTTNGSRENENVRKGPFASATATIQETRAMNRNAEFENDAIECDLKVANKVIEEAIRNEMRLSDVVRRVIALPVANPDSVQIPITLTEADYQLLAIRYGLSAADKSAIKNRIIEELNDFSGNKRQ